MFIGRGDMNKTEIRRKQVSQTMNEIRGIMDRGTTVSNLNNAKAKLIALASHDSLFSFDEFPLPKDDAMECSYLIHEFDDGSYSLYVNSGAPHQYYPPHDHGDAWAIITGVQGRERHQMFVKREKDAPGDGLLTKKAEIIAAPGDAVTMLPDSIHEVNAMDNQPLLHLHLYAKSFINQGVRWKYDLARGAVEKFHLDELGSITDAR